MKQQHTITTLPPSPEAERRARMIKYTIAMSIRVLCIFLMLFAQGWWLVVCAAGAIVLPYIAVVLANVGGGEQGVPERPGALVAVPRSDDGRADAPAEPRPVDEPGGVRGGEGDLRGDAPAGAPAGVPADVPADEGGTVRDEGDTARDEGER
jgi:hypothetical protein